MTQKWARNLYLHLKKVKTLKQKATGNDQFVFRTILKPKEKPSQVSHQSLIYILEHIVHLGISLRSLRDIGVFSLPN